MIASNFTIGPQAIIQVTRSSIFDYSYTISLFNAKNLTDTYKGSSHVLNL